MTMAAVLPAAVFPAAVFPAAVLPATALPRAVLPRAVLPATVRTLTPVSLPSRLVEQRPDVRAAEANMHAASAQVGVTIAARLPNILLSANGGSSSYNLAQSFTPGAGFYTLAASATAPIFDGFTLYNRQKAAEAALSRSEAQLRALAARLHQAREGEAIRIARELHDQLGRCLTKSARWPFAVERRAVPSLEVGSGA